jgi:hypothetical protein
MVTIENRAHEDSDEMTVHGQNMWSTPSLTGKGQLQDKPGETSPLQGNAVEVSASVTATKSFEIKGSASRYLFDGDDEVAP